MPTLFQISIEVNSGSVGKIAEQIGQVAIDNGWESYITYARNHQPSQSKVIRIGSYWDIYWHGLQTRLFDNHCLCSTRATKSLIKKIEKIKPDIIQLHHIHGYFMDMEVLFNYLSAIDTPVVWIFHDCWSITGHCAHFDYVGCYKWKTQCYNCVQKKEYPGSLLFDRSRKNYTQKKSLFNSVKNLTIISVSDWLNEIIEQSFLNKHSLKVIQNGIDIDVFSPQENLNKVRDKLGVGNKTMLLGVASTWEKRKGLYDFLKLQDLIDENRIIVLVGLSNKQINQLPKQIIGIKRTENVQQLATLYSAADVFINPTWEDTFPTTNLEALACGTPVITYRTGGSVESVSQDTGFVVDKGDIQSIVECIKIIETKGKSTYSALCRERAVKMYNKNDRYKDYISLYDKLLRK